MRYKYCPGCDALRPMTFLMDGRCEQCRGDALTIKVRRSSYGAAMYITSALAAAMALLYLAHRDLEWGLASFISGIDETLYISLVFGLIVLSFIFSYLDLGRTNQEARRIVDARKGRVR
jgi:hypothetical protein